MLDEALARYSGGLASRIDEPFGRTHGPSDPESFLLQRAVVEHIVRHPSPDRLFVQEALIAVLERTVAQAYSAGSLTGGESTPAATARRRVSREMQCFLALGYRENLTLKRIAATFGHSPFQLCRIFRSETGTTIHRYLKRIRLRRALEHVTEGHSDLARLALELGFSSHSHFTQSFRREFGISPSKVRDLRSPRRPLQVRENLTV